MESAAQKERRLLKTRRNEQMHIHLHESANVATNRMKLLSGFAFDCDLRIVSETSFGFVYD